MILNSILGRRYFRLMDQLSTYAHERLRVVDDDEFWTGEPPRGIGEDGQRETIAELWKNRGIIDDYVRDNPNAMGQADLNVIASWKSAFTGTFFVDRAPDGVLYFFAGDYLFDVCGMSLDIASSLTQIPTLIHATLLPYAGHVVYDMSLLEMPLVLDGEMCEVFAKEFDEVYRARNIVRTDSAFLSVAPQLEERRTEAALEQFRHEMELEEQAKEPGPGQHRGVLAGLSDEERRAAIAARIQELGSDRDVIEGVRRTLDSWLSEGPLATSATELFAQEDLPSEEEFVTHLIGRSPDESAGLADIFVNGSAEERQEATCLYDQARNELAASVAEKGVAGVLASLFVDKDGMQRDFELETPLQSKALRRLADAGGRMSLPYEQIDSLARLPRPAEGLCYYFREGDTIEVVMPDEVVPIVRGLDWQAIEQAQWEYERLVRFVDDTVELRGIARYEDVLAEYLAAYPEVDLPIDELDKTVSSAIVSEDSVSCILDTDDGSYLVHYMLAIPWYEDLGMSFRDEGPFMEGSLGDLFEGLLFQHQGKAPRVVTAEMMEYQDLFAWKEAQLPVRLLRDYLDANVPDEADDCFFADRVLEDLLEEAMWGLSKGSVERFSMILEDNDFVPNEGQLHELLRLWQNLCNSLPCWPNNGWAPNELLARSTDRKVFYNPDGSVMRVGRNDPCPCGSGKKYKRCHGR